MKIYNYFVFYQYFKSKESGIGNVVMQNTSKIENEDDIRAMQEALCNKFNYRQVVISNFKLLNVKR